MTITKLKTKNQITIPKEVVKKLNLKYTQQELTAIDKIVEKEKVKAKTVKAGKEVRRYLRNFR